ncbi:thioredoxin domain-containing protein [Agromyces sp. Leaf222]|uniref:DsbA family protein n=1 Tax=Agromyces sp. Leaf222 TaxID=1735688 RepID=UPI0009E6ED08|nr:thioredoxin domain-containing protein [Agromyces sp. Leaf222]
MTAPRNPSKATRPATPTGTVEKARTRRVLWINVGAVFAFLLVVVIIFLVTRPTSSEPNANSTTAPNEVIREDSHILGEPGATDVTLVEFLDFECEACGAAFPFIESLRQKYAGEVTFVARYFPIPSHQNALNAAIAAEAAGRQDKFEEMYMKLFETQTQWAEQQDSKADVFRQYADELGLDLDQYDADVADPTTEERVLSDQTDGTALGVSGTPTLFLNGELLELRSADDLTSAIDAALGR